MASEELMRRLFGFELCIDPQRFESALPNLFRVRDTSHREIATSTSSVSARGARGGDGNEAEDASESLVRAAARRLVALLLSLLSAHCRPPIGSLSVRMMAWARLGSKLTQHSEVTQLP